MYSFKESIKKCALPITKTESREVHFLVCFLLIFIIDLLMQHKFENVYLNQ